MYTTITVNGPGGSRLLAFLGARRRRIPRALEALLYGRVDSVEVGLDLADEVADFVERLLEDGELVTDEPPLLFSPNVGDGVAIVRDVLLEFQPPARRAPRIWRFVPRGTRGRVIARHLRGHPGELESAFDRVLLEPSREVAYVRPRCMTGSRFWSVPRRRGRGA